MTGYSHVELCIEFIRSPERLLRDFQYAGSLMSHEIFHNTPLYYHHPMQQTVYTFQRLIVKKKFLFSVIYKMARRKDVFILLIVLQIIFIILFGCLVNYDEDHSKSSEKDLFKLSNGSTTPSHHSNRLHTVYPSN